MRHAPVDDGLHDVCLATKRRDRKAAADALGQCAQVWLHTDSFRCAAIARGQSGLDLVEDQQDAVAIAGLAHTLQVARIGHDDREVLEHRLHDQGRDLARVQAQHLLKSVKVVVGHDVHDSRFGVPLHHRNRGIGRPGLIKCRLHRNCQRVVAAVVTTFDLDDGFATGGRTRRAYRVHGGFSARVGEPHQIEMEAALHALCRLGRDGRRRDEQGACLVQHARHVVDDDRVEVADEHGTEAHGHVEHAAPVDIGYPSAACGLNRERMRIPMLEGGWHPQRK